MKPKTLILLAVAGGCGLVAMLGVQQAMKMTQDSARIETKKVLVALANIEIGEVLNPESTVFKELPVEGLPPQEELIISPEQYEERGARVQLFAGDVITLSKLTEPGGTGNSVKIPKGMRVITIPVDESDSQSNLVSPGDRVDVLVTYQSGGGRSGNTKTKTLMEFVEVFAADSRTADKALNAEKTKRTSHVSLLVMPEQVNYVKLAQKKGNLSLAWRHKLDDELVQIRDIDEDLLEELEGTIGINETRPLYGQNFSEEIASPGFEPFVPVKEPVEDEPAAAFTLVEEAQPAEVEVVQPVVEPQVVQAPEKPKWTLHVYAGNTPTPHQFELPEEVIEEATATAGKVNPLAETVRSLLNGG